MYEQQEFNNMLLGILPHVKKLIDFQEFTGLPLLPELKDFYSTAIDYLQNPCQYDFISVIYRKDIEVPGQMDEQQD